MKKSLICASLTLLLTGCANHLRYETLNAPQKIRSEPELEFFINVESEVVSNPIVKFKIDQIETVKVTESEDITKREVYTPYSGAREFFEVPSGLILLPISFAISLADFATLGYIPNEIADEPIFMSFAGMNPFLNWESEDRIEKKELSTDHKVIDEKKDISRVPSRNTPFDVKIGDSVIQKLKTDKKGNAEVKILARQFMEHMASLREFEITVGEDRGIKDTKKMIIDRQLRIKINKSKVAIRNYNKLRTPEALADTVLALEKLGFKRIAYDFETYQLDKKDDRFKTDYDEAISARENGN